MRETFRDSDLIRFHPIITHGGEVVNAIPERVNIESYVRGKTFDAIRSANSKINRALAGAALSVGCNVEILDVPGYAPLKNCPDMVEAARVAAPKVLGDIEFRLTDNISSGSTDMGDLSVIMPAMHPYVGGASGHGHGNDYKVADPELACVMSAKLQLSVLLELLGNNAQRAKEIVEKFEPQFASINDYLDYLESVFSDGDRILYNENGEATMRIN
jgi:metal-dependent amidase/aminoacylase/carboxypeptidase family protein